MNYNIFIDPIKGRKCVALKFIPKLTIILRERPFLILQNSNRKHVFEQLKNNLQLANKLMNLAPMTQYVNINKDNIEEYIDLMITKININAFKYENKYTGVFFWASMFNHNCDPNVFYYEKNGEKIFYASKNIEKNEEICISYINILPNVYERRQLLRKWNFSCKCTKCKEDIMKMMKKDVDTHKISYDELVYLYKFNLDDFE